MRRVLLLFHGFLAPVLLAATPRVSFIRTMPAAHDIGRANNAALIYAIGDTQQVDSFVEVLVEHTNRSEGMHIENTVAHAQHVLGARPGEATLRAVRRDHPADVYLGVNAFTCTTTEHGGEGSERDVDGARVRRRHVWVDAACTARVDVLDRDSGKRVLSFEVRGEGTSPRVSELTKEERNIALEQAARFAAISASEGITPREVRESIEMDETAPVFDDGQAMIDAGRLTEARAIWEAALRQHRDSAALHFDLGAVCEALGDLTAARDYYETAQRLSPNRRYRLQLDLFKLRNEKAPPRSATLQ